MRIQSALVNEDDSEFDSNAICVGNLPEIAGCGTVGREEVHALEMRGDRVPALLDRRARVEAVRRGPGLPQQCNLCK